MQGDTVWPFRTSLSTELPVLANEWRIAVRPANAFAGDSTWLRSLQGGTRNTAVSPIPSERASGSLGAEHGYAAHLSQTWSDPRSDQRRGALLAQLRIGMNEL